MDDIAWKKVKGEVFRRPRFMTLFSIGIGNGVQVMNSKLFIDYDSDCYRPSY
jgi:uncharacterized membrane protein YeiB